jgi:Type IV secretion system pilin
MKTQIKRLLKVSPVLSFLAFIPLTTSAAFGYCDARGGLYDLLCKIVGLLGDVIPVLVALGVVYLVWGIVMYVIADDAEAKTVGRDRMIFGIIGLAVIISVWGLVYILTNTFNTRDIAPDRVELRGLLP